MDRKKGAVFGKKQRIAGKSVLDGDLLQPLVQEAVRQQVPLTQVATMKDLGAACGIAVGAAIAALV